LPGTIIPVGTKRTGIVIAIAVFVATSLSHLTINDFDGGLSFLFHLVALGALLAGLAMIVSHSNDARDGVWCSGALILWSVTSIRYSTLVGGLALVLGIAGMIVSTRQLRARRTGA
jgi:hypothetical protein